jgi:CHAT domain-containing protein/tetratricopeptide (TPR) repeat protein
MYESHPSLRTAEPVQYAFPKFPVPVVRWMGPVVEGVGSAALQTWLMIADVREQRRWLAAHGELLDPDCVAALETAAREARAGLHRLQLASDRAVLATARDAGVDHAYFDVYGPFALDSPTLLITLARSLGPLLDNTRRLTTGRERAALLSDALEQSHDDTAELAAPVAAALLVEWAVAVAEDPTLPRAEAYETAIAAVERATAELPAVRYPHRYAATQLVRGNLLMDRISGGYAASYELAIASYRAAADVFDATHHPIENADAQTGLGVAYQYRRTDERRANQERAFGHYQAAIDILTAAEFPHEHAHLRNSLAALYWQRELGDRATNMERGLEHLLHAAEMWDIDAFPVQRGRAEHNLGLMYSERLAGDRHENMEAAIRHTQRALTVFTAEQFPVRHGQGLLNLSGMYAARPAGDRVQNLDAAADLLRDALAIRTREAFPNEYAVTQAALAEVLASYPDRARTVDAIAGYRAALSVWTLDFSPYDHRDNQLRLAELLGGTGDWARAADAYAAAAGAQDRIVALGSGVAGQDHVLKQGRDGPARRAYALVRLGRPDEAAAAIEQSRARWLAATLAIDSAAPESISDPGRRSRYRTARSELIEAQREMNEPLPIVDDDRRRDLALERMLAFRRVRDRFDAIVAEIRTAGDPPTFLNAPTTASTIMEIVRGIGPRHVLIYVIATPWGAAAIVVTATDVVALDLPALRDELIDHLGGFGTAQAGRAWPLLLEQAGDTARACADRLPPGSDLTAAFDAAAMDPEFALLAGRRVDQLTRDQQRSLAETLTGTLLRKELKRAAEALRPALLEPLVRWLAAYEPSGVSLVPCGRLGAFPLTAITLGDGRTLGERWPATTTPNARVLGRTSTGVRTGLVALGNPTGDLPWSEVEATAVAQTARRAQLAAEAAIGADATRERLLEALRHAEVVNVSCHGTLHAADPLRSALRTAGPSRVTMGELLDGRTELAGLRLLVLSACQTAVIDPDGPADEVRNLAAAVLQAGAGAVLASLWPVDDRATCLLVARFAEEWLPRRAQEGPAAALARAQRWLRTSTAADLDASCPPGIVLPDMTRRTTRVRGGPADEPARRLEATQTHGRPYAEPYFWAGLLLVGW